MTRSILVLSAAFALACGAANAGETGAPVQVAQADMDAAIGVDLATVPDPAHDLTNLTVYAHGTDVGHIAQVDVGRDGHARRLQIVFNRGLAPIWVGADELRYDPQHRLITA